MHISGETVTVIGTAFDERAAVYVGGFRVSPSWRLSEPVFSWRWDNITQAAWPVYSYGLYSYGARTTLHRLHGRYIVMAYIVMALGQHYIGCMAGI